MATGESSKDCLLGVAVSLGKSSATPAKKFDLPEPLAPREETAGVSGWDSVGQPMLEHLALKLLRPNCCTKIGVPC